MSRLRATPPHAVVFAVALSGVSCSAPSVGERSTGPRHTAPPRAVVPSRAGPESSGGAPSGSRAAAALPGRCEPIPQASWVIHVSSRQASPRDAERGPGESGPVRRAMRTHSTIDVDGDGTPDVVVPVPGPRDCPHEAPFDLYVVRGACGHRVGRIVGSPEATTSVSASGGPVLPELTTSTTYGEQGDPREPAVRRTDRRTYRFEAGVYREVTTTSDTSVCHHCSSSTCVVQSE